MWALVFFFQANKRIRKPRVRRDVPAVGAGGGAGVGGGGDGAGDDRGGLTKHIIIQHAGGRREHIVIQEVEI